jgi:hypothetical protein
MVRSQMYKNNGFVIDISVKLYQNANVTQKKNPVGILEIPDFVVFS